MSFISFKYVIQSNKITLLNRHKLQTSAMPNKHCQVVGLLIRNKITLLNRHKLQVAVPKTNIAMRWACLLEIPHPRVVTNPACIYGTPRFFVPKALQLTRPEAPHTWLSPRTPNSPLVTTAHKNLKLLNKTARIYQESVIYICVKGGYQSSYVCITEPLPARWQSVDFRGMCPMNAHISLLQEASSLTHNNFPSPPTHMTLLLFL